MLKERIRRGDTILGTFVFSSSPEIVEILALAGMDYIIIDTEHSPKDWSTIQHMIRAANLHKLPVLIRVRENSEKLILQYLEIGADGLVVPFVQSSADVVAATRAMYYSPEGNRGTCTLTRMTGYGARRSEFLQHCKTENKRLVLFAQIEDRSGVDNISSIVATEPGIDVVLVGRSDLASAYGSPGNVEAPEVLDATDRILRAAESGTRQVPTAMGIYSTAEAERWKAKGCKVFFAPSDGVLAFNGAKSWIANVEVAGR